MALPLKRCYKIARLRKRNMRLLGCRNVNEGDRSRIREVGR